MVAYDSCSAEDIRSGLESAKKRKIIALLTRPAVLSQYLWKLYKIKGAGGLLDELVSKTGYLLERKRRP